MSPDDALKFGSLLGAAMLILVGIWRTVRNSISMRGDVSSLRQDMQALTESRDRLRSEVSTLQQQLEDKTRVSYERDARIDSLTQQVREISNTARLIENTNNNLQGRLAEQRDILGTQITQQAAEIALLRLDVKSRDGKITDLEQSQTSKEAALNEAGAMIAKLEAELAQEKREREELDKRVKALEQQVRDMKVEREQIIAERDQALADLAKAREEITRLKDELKKAQEASQPKVVERPADQPSASPA